MLVKTRTQKHWFRSEAVILNTPLLSYGHFLSESEPSNPKIFKLFTSDLKNNSHLFPLGEAKWTPKNQIVFKLFTCRLENYSHLFLLRNSKCTPNLQSIFKTFTTRRKKNCKTKKPPHTSGNRNKRGRKNLSALIFCFKPKICNGSELNQSKRKKKSRVLYLSPHLAERDSFLLSQRA